MPNDLPPERTGERGRDLPPPPRLSPPPEPDLNEAGKKAYAGSPEERRDEIDEERGEEQVEGITEERRGSAPAPSDRPENHPPHPMDVNEFDQRRPPRGMPERPSHGE